MGKPKILGMEKVASVKTTTPAEDLGMKMKLPKTPEMTLEDMDGLTAQVFMTKPGSCKNKRAQRGECWCEQHCLLAMHHSAQAEIEIGERDAAELGEVKGLFYENDETKEDGCLLQSRDGRANNFWSS